jgi:hypothetical protein
MTIKPPEITPVAFCLLISGKLNEVVERSIPKNIALADRSRFISEHAKNVAMLLTNIGNMSNQLHAYGVRQLVRPMMESMFNMIAAMRNAGFAQSKMLSECEHHVRVLTRQRNKPGQSQATIAVMDKSIIDINAASQIWKTANSVTSCKWSTYDICKEAECEHWYFQYQFLCEYAHSAYNNLNPFLNYTRGMLLSQSALIGANTLYEYRQYLNANKEDEHRKEAEFIKSLFDQMEQDGSFASLQWED